MVVLNSIVHYWWHRDPDTTVPGLRERWLTKLRLMEHTEYIAYMVRVARLTRLQFPGDPAKRWREMARAAIETDSAGNRIVL